MFQHKLCDPAKKKHIPFLSTPWKINMEHTHHPFRKKIMIWTKPLWLCSMVIFRECSETWNHQFEILMSSSYIPNLQNHCIPAVETIQVIAYICRFETGCRFFVTVLRVLPVPFARPAGAGDGHSFGWKSYRPYRSPGATREEKRTESTPEINGVSWFP